VIVFFSLGILGRKFFSRLRRWDKRVPFPTPSDCQIQSTMSYITEVPADLSGVKNPRNESAAVHEDVNLIGKGSPGVRRIEVITSYFRMVDRVCLFIGVFLIAYVYGLDGTVRYTYQVRHSALHLGIRKYKLIPRNC
jgi:hypothetical protein